MISTFFRLMSPEGDVFVCEWERKPEEAGVELRLLRNGHVLQTQLHRYWDEMTTQAKTWQSIYAGHGCRAVGASARD